MGLRKTDGFAWLYVCVSLNLVTCVFYLIVFIYGNNSYSMHNILGNVKFKINILIVCVISSY